MTQKEFCTQNNLKVPTFAYWVTKKKRSQAPSGGFALIDSTGESANEQVDITYPNGVRLSTGIRDLSLIGQLIRLY